LRRAGLPETAEIMVATLAQMRQRAAGEVETAHKTARAAAERIEADFPQWRVSAEWLAGGAAFSLMQKAAEWDADLIVVGSQNRSAVGRLLLGSVSRQVVSEADCSVRVARRSGLLEQDAPRRLVAGFDNAENARLLTAAIARREWLPGSVVRLVTATSAEEKDVVSPVGQIINAQDFQRAAKAELEARGLKVLTKVIEADAESLLLAEAETLAADCIFVGSRGIQGALNRFLLGSVSAAVVTNAPCSVEVVRAREI
jgi:nucleotide-binding universal stress UspA family protein